MTTARHSSSCPNCGIAVSAGYRKCPKCHGELPDQPGAGGQAPSAEAQRIQGGTALDSVTAPPWFAIGIGVALVAMGVGAFVLTRGAGDSTGPSLRVRQTTPTGATARPRAAAQPVEDPDRRAEEPRGRTEGIDTRSSAVKLFEASELLQAEIEGRRLWATVEVDGTGLAVRSAYCADPGMKASIDKLLEALQASGAQAITCYERHGPEVFQRALGAEPPVP